MRNFIASPLNLTGKMIYKGKRFKLEAKMVDFLCYFSYVIILLTAVKIFNLPGDIIPTPQPS